MRVQAGNEYQIEERPCPTCGGIVKLYRDQDGGLLFAAPGQSLLHQERDELRRELVRTRKLVVEAAEKGAVRGWREGYEFARKRLSVKGRLIGAVLWMASPAYRSMRRNEKERGNA
jgi:hypothetical protein